MTKRPDLSGILEKDDASAYLAGLTDEQRRPQYITNSLPTSPETFSDEEVEAALALIAPQVGISKMSGLP